MARADLPRCGRVLRTQGSKDAQIGVGNINDKAVSATVYILSLYGSWSWLMVVLFDTRRGLNVNHALRHDDLDFRLNGHELARCGDIAAGA